MKIDANAFESLSDSFVESHLPERPVTSLRDIQFVYGKLVMMATGAAESDFGAYLTPFAAGHLLDEDADDESVIAVRVSMSDGEPSYEGIFVTRYTRELVPLVAHAKYDAAKGIDHSITHLSGKNNPLEKIGTYATERLTKWPSDTDVQSVAQEDEDGWIIDGLDELGDDDEILSQIREDVESRLDGKRTALLTVQVDLGDGWLWPGEITVFNRAMAARKRQKLIRNSAFWAAEPDASGEGVCMVTGEETTESLIGIPIDPLNYMRTKQREKFRNLDISESWRTHPVSEEAALVIGQSSPFVEACHYSTFGARVYALPYVNRVMTVDDAHALYSLIVGVMNESSNKTPLEMAVDGDFLPERLRLYTIVIEYQQKSRFNVFRENPNGQVLTTVEIANGHNAVLESPVFGETGTTAMFKHVDEWNTLTVMDNSMDRLGSIIGGLYVLKTADEKESDELSPADPRFVIQEAILGGEPVSTDVLLAEYTARIMDAETESGRIPTNTISQSFAQFCALSRAGVITSTRMDDPITEIHKIMTQYDVSSDEVRRSEKLETVLDSVPALNVEGPRRAGFLLGVLVARLSRVQAGRGVSSTLSDQFPVKSVSPQTFENVVTTVLDRDFTYASMKGASVFYAEVVDALRETMLAAPTSEWEVSVSDLRYHYALGLAYGSTDQSTEYRPNESPAQEATQ